jgi:hypothetical protein
LYIIYELGHWHATGITHVDISKSMGLKFMDITKTGLLSNDDMITISPYACMPYQSWPRDPFLGSMETTKLAFVICLA